jgi:hypothetical protein
MPLTERPAFRKRKVLEILTAASHANVSTSTVGAEVIPDNDAENIEGPEKVVGVDHVNPQPFGVDKGVQVRTPYRSRTVQTDGQRGQSVATSPLKLSVQSVSTSPVKVIKSLRMDCDSSSSDDGDDQYCAAADDDPSTDEVLEPEEASDKEASFRCLHTFMEKDPKLYLGIAPESYIILSLLCEKVETSSKNIMLCLKKIKLNDHVKVLGNEFGLHYSTVSRVLKDCMPIIARYMSDLLYWPSEESRLRTLPMAFIANFSAVTCIIDCLEITIEKPSNPLLQAQSWSQYKKANTIKYFISCLPNGFINFISEGYLGRASDEAITLDCGFLDTVPPGSTIMADRGFKHLEADLAARSCKLVRPPSVSSGHQMTKGNVRLTKQIASLRIHVERVIGRIRDFGILKPTAVMDHNLVSLSDSMIIIACGLVNLSAPVVRT